MSVLYPKERFVSTPPPSAFATSTPGTLSRRAWGTLLVLCGALFLDALDVSMMGVALPSIRSDLGMSTSSLQWVVSGYVLGYGGFLLLGGRAADLLGRRRVFLISLGVFLVASGLGGLTNDGTLLIATRFLKGVSAAFTAPAGLSIITTSFPEGPARNKALSIYSATGAAGFSLGLVFSGILTEFSWRLVCFMPVPIALATLIAAVRLVPDSGRTQGPRGSFDFAGAVSITAGMLFLVYTLVEAPNAGWGSAQTIGSLVASAAILAGFVVIEQRQRNPLVRLGILRSGALVRANLGAMSLIGAWFGAQFILTMYMQELRGWSALETGLAIFPAGLIVALLAPKVVPLVMKYGTSRVILAGLISTVATYALLQGLGNGSSYPFLLLPAFIFGGIGFGLAYGPLTMAATNGIAPEEQGLAGGLVNTSFQFGGALVLAIVTAVNNANIGPSGDPDSLLDGSQAALVVPLIVAVLGVGATAIGLVRRTAPATAPVPFPEPAPAPVYEEAAD
jgi:EmrB/QacA subfamily drug resistance transporter